MTSTDPAPLDFGNPASALHKYAVAAAAMEDDRIDYSTRKGYESALRHFDNFCVKHKIFNVLTTRFPEQPALISLYLAKLVMSNLSEWSAEKARSAIVWHFSKTEISKGGHPADKWEEFTDERGELAVRGNPGTAAQVRRALRGLRKKERRLHRPLPRHAHALK
ncbi:hypothetical protein BBJ28_00006742 [Nothophytophthora sp. Chile5]|nr:hypothetical protein BBJ28_00006742 [Nothophytophthora sp. Chile5]